MNSRLQKKTLKKQCTTRWESKHVAIACMKERYLDVLKSLTAITLMSTKPEEQREAGALKKKLESYEFVLILVTWEIILTSLHATSKSLQAANIDLQQAQKKLKTSYHLMQETREKYEKIVTDAKSLCRKWGIPETFPVKRKRYAKKYFDELASDSRLDVSEDRFHVTVCLPVVDCIISQLNYRFPGMNEVAESFSFICPSVLLILSEIELQKCASDFAVKYSSDVSSDLVRQITTFRHYTKEDVTNLETIRNIATFILENGYCTSFPDLFTACLIFLTLPVTVASAERSFSKLKLIKINCGIVLLSKD